MWLLHAGSRDFDEGVYWQSVRAMARGEPLFQSVFTSQPPAFYYALLPFYLVSHSLVALRLSVLTLAIIGTAAAYAAGRLLGGPTAGLIAAVLLISSPLYLREAAIVQADMPTVAMMLVAVALAIATTREDATRVMRLAALTGIALAIAVGMKFLGAVAVVPIALLFLTPRRRPLRVIVACAGAFPVTLVVIFRPALGSPTAAYQDLILSHLRSGAALHAGPLANLAQLTDPRQLPLVPLAVAGAIMAIRRRDPRIVAPLGWSIAAIVAIVVYQPLFPHHLLILPPALALMAAVGFADLPLWRPSWLPAATGALVLAAAVGLMIGLREARQAFVPNGHDLGLAVAVRATTRPGDYVISDNPYAVALADRDLPGPLVDTSHERTLAGLLTVADLDGTKDYYGVKVVLTDSGRLQSVPGFSDWLAAHYRLIGPVGHGANLYAALQETD